MWRKNRTDPGTRPEERFVSAKAENYTRASALAQKIRDDDSDYDERARRIEGNRERVREITAR